MEKSTKILLAIGGTLVAGVGGYFIYKAATKPKSDDADANKVGSITPITPPPLTPEQVGVPTINPNSTQPTIPTLATSPVMPSLNDFNLGSFGTAQPETNSSEPTPSEYIRMADAYMTWENVWKFADKLGIKDKKVVGGVTDSNPNSIISYSSRENFKKDIIDKFPNWKQLIKDKAKKEGVTILTEQEYKKFNTDSYSFSGSNNNTSNFWTSKR